MSDSLRGTSNGDTVVTVQHHHQMHRVPCLSPGEMVTLMSFAEYPAQL